MATYRRNKLFYQWLVTLLFLIMLLLILGLWIQIVNMTKTAVLLIFVMVPVIQFLCTPIFTLVGVYTYFSPMVVAFGATQPTLDLHNGTSYDYLLKMRNIKPGVTWKKTMLRHYLDALLVIIQKMEAGQLSEDTTIRGSSYFLSERSTSKLGFKTSTTSIAEKVNIALNYLDLIWMYSLGEGRWVWPDLSNIKTVSIKGQELIKQKAYLLELRQYLTNRA